MKLTRHLSFRVGGASVQTFDVCFHPQTLQHASRSANFHEMVARSAIDGVEKAMLNMGKSSVQLEQSRRVLFMTV